MLQKGLFFGIVFVFIFSCGYYLGVSQNARIENGPLPAVTSIEDFKADYVRKEIASLRVESEKNSSPKEERINKDEEILLPPSPKEILLSEEDLIVEKDKEPVEANAEIAEVPLEDEYDARAEIQKRLEGYNKYCEGRRRSLIGVSFITGYISRYGVSTGDVHFWTCFLPKAASSSLSVTTLLATGYIPLDQKNTVETKTWDEGRNKCNDRPLGSGQLSNCLHKYAAMPQKYRYMGANLEPDDKFASIIVGREPMSRLVSAWKDKIYRGSDRTFYYKKVKTAFSQTKTPKCANYPTSEAAWEAGCRLEFKDFANWVARGNFAADEHWRPAADLCAMCALNLSFIGHSEHYGEDAQVLAEQLNIPKSYLPDDYSKSNEHAAALNANAKKASLDEMFADLPRETLISLRRIYEPDYIMLGYEMPEWLANA